MGRIFDQEGPVIGAMNALTAIVGLNLLTFFFSIPIVTGGAAVATMHFILMQMREGSEGKMIPTFWKQFKGNLKTATVPWLLCLLAAGLVYGDYRLIYVGEILPKNFMIPIAVAAALVAAVSVFEFPLLGKFENSFKGTLKNAAILAVANFPRTLAIIVIHLVIWFLFTQVIQLLPLFWLMGISLPAYLSSLIYWPVIKKLIPEEENEADGSEEDEAIAE